MTGPLDADRDRAFQKAWNDRSLTLKQVGERCNLAVSTIQTKAVRFRQRGISMIDRRKDGVSAKGDTSTRDAEIARAWNDTSLDIDAVCKTLGLTRHGLYVATVRLREKDTPLINRGRYGDPIEPDHEDPGKRPAPMPRPSIAGAIVILQRQKRAIRVQRGVVYLDGRIVTSLQLLEAAYGTPAGKYL